MIYNYIVYQIFIIYVLKLYVYNFFIVYQCDPQKAGKLKVRFSKLGTVQYGGYSLVRWVQFSAVVTVCIVGTG